MEYVTAPFRSFALVSRESIARNYRRIKEAVGPGVDVAGVVKADAYGHGAAEVSRVLEAEGARWLAVSSVEEGVALREAGISARILVMAGFLPHEGEAMVEHELTPALQSLTAVAEMDRLARLVAKPLPYHLKIDSGMGRMGAREGAGPIAAAVRGAAHARLEGLMSHLASAADFTSPQTEEQIAHFEHLCRALAEAGIAPPYRHTASTNAVAYGRKVAWHNMVRAGLGVYGYVPEARGEAPPQTLDVEPALTWKARIIAVKDMPEGAPVGYGATFRAPRPMRMAIVAAGYADGVFHSLANRGCVIAAGRTAPIVGSVCMDVIAIDISYTTALGPGDEVTLLGAEGGVKLDAEDMARTAGTISYDILCRIGRRVARVYV